MCPVVEASNSYVGAPSSILCTAKGKKNIQTTNEMVCNQAITLFSNKHIHDTKGKKGLKDKYNISKSGD